MVQHIEHFESFENYDPIEDKLVMVYKETDIKIVDKDSAKKLIERPLKPERTLKRFFLILNLINRLAKSADGWLFHPDSAG